jgi:hypothetical protein
MIENNSFSLVKQDVFVAKIIGSNGYYLDIGCGDGIGQSNSLLLERDYNWSGLLIDNDDNALNQCRHHRPNNKNIFKCDAANPSVMLSLLQENNCPRVIDYISLDIDDASLDGLIALPLDKYEFKLMTFEHDIYVNREICNLKKSESHKILLGLGYKCLAENVFAYENNSPYEDWFFNPKHIDENIFKNITIKTGISANNIISLLNI